MWVSLPDAEYTDTAAWMRLYERLVERVEALPGVRGVGMNNVIPLGTGGSESEALPDNRPVELESTASALFQTVQRRLLRDARHSTAPRPDLRPPRSRCPRARGDHRRDDGGRVLARRGSSRSPRGVRVRRRSGQTSCRSGAPWWASSATYVTTNCACLRVSRSTSPSRSRRRTSTGGGGRCRSSSRPTATRRTRSAPCAASSPVSTPTSHCIPCGPWTRFSRPRSARTAC